MTPPPTPTLTPASPPSSPAVSPAPSPAGPTLTPALPPEKPLIYLDLLRGGAAFLVVLLHCITPYLTSPNLFSGKAWWLCDLLSPLVRMGVPLFFMMSGFLLLNDPRTLDISSFYKRRFSRLALPFFFWDLFYFLTNCLFSHQFPSLFVFFKELLNQGSKYHLWYLYQLAGLYLLAPFLKRIVDNCTKKQLFALICVILTPTTFFRFLNVVQPYVTVSPFKALMEGYTGFFLLGYLLGKYNFSRKERLGIYAAGVAGYFLGAIGNYLTSSPEYMALLFNEGYAINHFLTSSAVFTLARHLPQGVLGRLGRVARPLARVSLGVYLVHPFLLTLVSTRVQLASPALTLLIHFLLVSGLSVLVSWVLSKIPVVRRVVT